MRRLILLAFVVLFVLVLVQQSDSWWSRRRSSSGSVTRRRRYVTRRRRSYIRWRVTRRRRRRRVVCPSITCKNGGTRYCSGSSAYCRCRTGYYGSRCGKGCGYLYCYNGGKKICRSTGWWTSSKKVAKCNCPRGTGGRQCKTIVCPSITCKNGGTRYCRGSYAYCRCRTGYYGSRCGKGCGYLYCYNRGTKICHSIKKYTHGYGTWYMKVAKCNCPRGFYGTQCKKQECSNLKCYNGGTKICRTVSSGWWISKRYRKEAIKCNCPRWYKGKQCRQKFCRDMKCLNGGKRRCRRAGDAYCICKRDFNGKNCQNGCKYKMCDNGGTKTCVKDPNQKIKVPKCRCRIGFHGHDCRHSCPKLKMSCVNGGKTHCTNHAGLFTFSHCVCPPGYNGKQCECHGSSCLSANGCKRIKRCLNGGTKICMKPHLIYFEKAKCQCPIGYYGRICGKQCRPLICKNGGKTHCTNHSGALLSRCVCPTGYKGKHCEIPKCKPDRKNCVNGDVKCRNETQFICICSKDYTGPRCDIRIHPLLTVKQGRFTFEAERNNQSDLFCRRLHVFSNSSGVTVGRGYDLKDKTPKQIKQDLIEAGINGKLADKQDLVEAGINGTIADQLKTAAGLIGDKARKWIKDKHLGNFTITRKQDETLFNKEYKRKAKIAKTTIEKYSKNKLKFKQLSQVAKDIVIDIFYRGDYSMSNDFPKKKKRSVKMQKAFDKSKNKQQLKALYKLVMDYDFWVSEAGVDKLRFKARVCYVYRSKPPPRKPIEGLGC